MSKQIVVCMDGTWNDPTERTNVYKLFQFLDGQQNEVAELGPIRSHLSKTHDRHTAFYLEGVGANGREKGLLGGSLGVGLHDRIIDAFVLVSQAYQAGDKLWIFGFSRGAWAARSLAGLIAKAGVLPDAGTDDAAQRAEQLWLDSKHGHIDRNHWLGKDAQAIKLVGVWDTVGALGIPFFNGMRVVERMEKSLFDFSDLDLSQHVEFGRHAMAIDETRADFAPTPWNPRSGIRQTWFAGVHGDVGGGYPHCGLSDISLQWMIDEINALHAGLQVVMPEGALQPQPLMDRHDESIKLVWQLRPVQARDIPVQAELYPSVLQRLRNRIDYRPPALRAVAACKAYFLEHYQPAHEQLQAQDDASPCQHLPVGGHISVTVFAQNWWNAAGLEVCSDECYSVTAQGNWKDKNTETDAQGYPSDGNLLLRSLESTRRLPEANWFALIAAAYHDSRLEARNPASGNFLTGITESYARQVGKIDQESQLQVIAGATATLNIVHDGYLYFFANDAKFAYSNNSGALELHITRTA